MVSPEGTLGVLALRASTANAVRRMIETDECAVPADFERIEAAQKPPPPVGSALRKVYDSSRRPAAWGLTGGSSWQHS